MNAHHRAAPLAGLTMLVALVSGNGRYGPTDLLPVPRPAAAETAAAATVGTPAPAPRTAEPAAPASGGATAATAAPIGGAQALPVDVASAGWVRVALEPAMRARTAPGGQDLRVVDPSGADLPFVVRAPEVPAPDVEVAVRLTGVEEAADGWRLRFDAGRNLAVRRFRFEIAEAIAVTGVRLEGSADGQRWAALAEGDVFRIGSSAELAGTTLDVDAVAGAAPVRYLRLHWPRAGGYPRVTAATVLPKPVRAPERRIDLTVAVVESRPGAAVHHIALPGPGLRLDRLDATWDGAGGIAYRLLRPAGGTWEVLREGEAARPASGAAVLSIDLPGTPLGAPFLRLVIDAGGTAPVAVTSARGWVAEEWLVFYAAAAGRHRVELGRLGMAPPPALRGAPPADLAAIPEGSAGPAEPLPLAELPPAVLAPGADLPGSVTFAATWPVVVDGAAPPGAAGEVVRLALPDDLYEVARPDLADIRVAFDAGDGRPARQVPFVRWSLPEPALAAVATGLVPTPAAAGETSTVAIELPARAVPYTLLDLEAPAAVFTRQVDVFVVESAAWTPADERRMVTSTVWSCPGAGRAPCRLGLALGPDLSPVWREAPAGAPTPAPAPGPRLEVVVHDGDDAPLPRIDARVWRRVDAVAFAWPVAAEGGAVRLVAGAPGLAAPRYDIDAIRDEVITRVMRDVTVAPRAAPDVDGSFLARLRTHARGVLVGALGLAAVGLLWLLARMLRGSGAPPG